MTIPEFISHLDTQPWSLSYVSNFFAFNASHKQLDSSLVHNFINDAFDWSNTPENHVFWSDIYHSLDYSCTCKLAEIKSALHSHYCSTHPEFFI